MHKKVLITTAIDYTNDVIHIGHAYQKILSDALARVYKKTHGEDNVRFLTGTDEHGTTNEKAAKDRNLTPLEHVTDISLKDKEQISALEVNYDRFIRTTDSDHIKIASDFFKKSFDNGDIYKGSYEGLYCDGCESYKTFSELNDAGQCLLHPTKQIQKISEENYFFKWSAYSGFLRDLITKNERFVLPEGKRTEMLSFLDQGLDDIAVTRPKYKVSWGIPCPIDSEQVIYVWFDALINYYTYGIQNGFWDSETEIIHILGKDNAKWHVLLWPAMLKSVGYTLPTTIYVHAFINLDGQKISKSRGNVIRPTDLVEKFGADAVRFYFLKHGPVVEDVDISLSQIAEVYNADLANGIGNTAARLAKLAERSGGEFEIKEYSNLWRGSWLDPVKAFRLDYVLQNIWNDLGALDKDISTSEPWKIKDNDELSKVMSGYIDRLRAIILQIEPFMPATSLKLHEHFFNKQIKSLAPLFPRI